MKISRHIKTPNEKLKILKSYFGGASATTLGRQNGVNRQLIYDWAKKLTAQADLVFLHESTLRALQRRAARVEAAEQLVEKLKRILDETETRAALIEGNLETPERRSTQYETEREELHKWLEKWERE